MSDSIRIGEDEYVPIQDTICECGHWYDEHDVQGMADGGQCGALECVAPGCICAGFIADSEQSTAAAIADRGGDPAKWPEHVKRAAEGWFR